MNRFKVVIILGLVAVFHSCTDSVSPSGPFEPHMVVYSILSSASDTQYVRVYTNYDVADHDALKNLDENTVADATVKVSDGSTVFPFHLVSITRADTTRYKSPVGLYVAYPFRPLPTKAYTLSVSSPSIGQTSSRTVIPGKGYVASGSVAELNDAKSRSSVFVFFSLNTLARAFLVRFFVTYTTENPGDSGTEHYQEILLVPLLDRPLDPNTEIIPRIVPTVKSVSAIVRIGQSTIKAVEYAFPAYSLSLNEIDLNNVGVRFKRAVFYLVQFDEPWYKSYASANLFQDRFGLRVDPPYYTDIQGGSGLFASFHVDSAVVVLPEKLLP